MSLDKLNLSGSARELLAAQGIHSLDEASEWVQGPNVLNIAEVYRNNKETFDEIQKEVWRYIQGAGSPFRYAYVAFIDILGFSKLVEEAEGEESAREQIRAGLKCYTAFKARHPNPEIHFTQFSDSIVLSSAKTENGLFYILEAAINISVSIFKAGFLTRGGIVSGHIEHTDELIFGKGLIDAYHMDISGGPPRIVVSEDIISDPAAQRMLTEVWSASIFCDEVDLCHAVNTLLYFQTYIGADSSAVKPEEADGCFRLLQSNATDLNSPASVREKWRWMARYWNRSVAHHGLLPSIAL